MESKMIIKEFNEYVDGFVECCTSDKQTHELLKAVAKLIEDQEERIAIMTEGKLTLDDFHDFLWNKYFGLKICEENMAFLNKWILEYKEHVKAEHERKKEGDPE